MEILEQIYAHASSETYRVTQHAQQQMVDEDIKLDDVLQAIRNG